MKASEAAAEVTSGNARGQADPEVIEAAQASAIAGLESTIAAQADVTATLASTVAAQASTLANQTARIAELEAQLSELDDQLKAKHDQVLRALAEADNAQRRAAIDVENASKFSVGGFAKDLLDDILMAGFFASFHDNERIDKHGHYQIHHKNDSDSMKRNKVKSAEARGRLFNRNIHHVMPI